MAAPASFSTQRFLATSWARLMPLSSLIINLIVSYSWSGCILRNQDSDSLSAGRRGRECVRPCSTKVRGVFRIFNTERAPIFLGQNRIEPYRVAGTFNVLTIFQPGPPLGSVNSRFVFFQAVLVWLPLFLHVADVEDLPSYVPEAGQIFIPPVAASSRWTYRAEDFRGGFECLFQEPRPLNAVDLSWKFYQLAHQRVCLDNLTKLPRVDYPE